MKREHLQLCVVPRACDRDPPDLEDEAGGPNSNPPLLYGESEARPVYTRL